MFKKTLLLSALFLVSASYGDVNGDLGNFFNSLGFDGNVTQAHAYQGQEAGYYSGGSMFLRNQVKNVQLVHIDVPDYSAGCGGIDAFLGGFSFVSAEKLIEMSKKIMSNASGYMFDLALETTVPELKAAKDYIQNMANKINSLNVNSCEAAQDLVGGMWPKTQASQRKVCKDIATQNNDFSDWAAARQACGATGGKFNEEMGKAAKDKVLQKQIVINKNLVWASLKNNALFNDDEQMMELLMTLSGTIIFDAKGQAQFLASMAGDPSLIKAFLYGGNTTIYKCTDSAKCLAPSVGSISISSDKSLQNQVSNMIVNIIDNVQSDSPISNQEMGFLNSTSIPILKFIAVLSSMKMNSQAMDLTQYSEVIAEDLLAQYLKENLQLVQASLKTNDLPPDVSERLNKKVQNALLMVSKMQTKAYQKLQDTMALVRNMRFVEEALSANLSSSLKENNNFGG